MPFIVPRRHTLRVKEGTIWSKYKNLDVTQHFALQQRKKMRGGNFRKYFRIVTTGTNPFYEVAYSRNLNTFRAEEWKYVCEDLPGSIPGDVDLDSLPKWFEAHFTKLTLSKNTSLSDISGEDSEEEMDGDKSGGMSQFVSDDEGPRLDSLRRRKTKKTPVSKSKTRSDRKIKTGSPLEDRRGVYKKSALSDMGLPGLPTVPVSPLKSLVAQKPMTRRFSSAPHTTSNSRLNEVQWNCRGLWAFFGTAAVVNVFPILLRETSAHTFWFALLVANVLAFALIVQGDPLTVSFIFTPKGTPLPDIHHSTGRRIPSFSADILPVEETKEEEVATDLAEVMKAKESGLVLPILSTTVKFLRDHPDAKTDYVDTADYKDFQVRKERVNGTSIKSTSKKQIFDFVGCDTFYSEKKLSHVLQHLALPERDTKMEADMKAKLGDAYDQDIHGDGDCCSVAPWLVVNWQIPSYAPPFFGGGPKDGKGWSIIFYYKLSSYGRELLKKESAPVAKLMKKFWDSDAFDATMKGRLKCIPTIVNTEEINLGGMMKTMLSKGNSKPFLTGPCHYFYKGESYYEIDIDVHDFCMMARKFLWGGLDVINDLVVDIGLVIEARDQAEMPEQLLCCHRLGKLQPSTANTLQWNLERFKEKQAAASN